MTSKRSADETSVQCIREVRDPIPAKAGQSERYDGQNTSATAWPAFDGFLCPVRELAACGRSGQSCRSVVGGRRPAVGAGGLSSGATHYFGQADNLNTHTGASLYKAFPPALARSLLDKLEFVYTPKHGSWLNRTECEFNLLSRHCLDRRLPDIESVTREVEAWTKERNLSNKPVDWRFTTDDARIKLKRLYPQISD